jgi:uncharacterized protein YjaZ
MTPEEMTMHAKALNDNPLFMGMFKEIEAGLLRKLKMANLADGDELIAIAATSQVVETIESYIQECIDNEKVIAFNNRKAG